ncbi:MAG TPA: M67 family metallopeptidase [Candidatus Acidoferrum sp.]|nr:M67 family metallopeptidase [Candidatus Acidoferrum sp.]
MSKHVLRISEDLLLRIGEHGAKTYPHECCGALLGRDNEVGREVVKLLPLPNRRNDSPRNRFELSPDDVRLAEKTARGTGLDLLGWYHSHPDAPARPSEFDRAHAWPWYSYIIVSIRGGRTVELNSWRLQDDRSAYDSEAIQAVRASDGVFAGKAAHHSAQIQEETDQVRSDECLSR